MEDSRYSDIAGIFVADAVASTLCEPGDTFLLGVVAVFKLGCGANCELGRSITFGRVGQRDANLSAMARHTLRIILGIRRELDEMVAKAGGS